MRFEDHCDCMYCLLTAAVLPEHYLVQAETFERLYKTEARKRAAAEQSLAREAMLAREKASNNHERVRRLEDDLVTVQRKAPTMQQTVVARRYLGLPV
eukprot:SAG22_NODE_3207_length_1857_cov_12.754266_2_plen_98_part_00